MATNQGGSSGIADLALPRSLSRWGWWSANSPLGLARGAHAFPERLVLGLVLLLGLAQAIVYLFLLPPWQHYDEPSHFEYAWRIAQGGERTVLMADDRSFRREIAASMVAYDFYRNLALPDLLADNDPIPIGYSQLNDVPGYYLLVSFPLRFVRHLDVASQLHVARTVSIVLFLLTVLVVAGLAHDLTPRGHPLRWALPVTVVLIPPFVDVMTAVNSDVGATLAFSVFLWGAVRLLRMGFTPPRLLWVSATPVLAIAMKGTAAVSILLAPVVLVLALWNWLGLRWRWLIVAGFFLLALGVTTVFSWGDAAHWHRATEQAQALETSTRQTDARTPLGNHVVKLVIPPKAGVVRLLNPVLEHDVKTLANQTITVGAWIWADQPGVASLGVVLVEAGALRARPVLKSIGVSASPTFVAWTLEVPPGTQRLNFALSAKGRRSESRFLELFLDGAVLVQGRYAEDTQPEFHDPLARTGSWAGQHFTNLLRNPSAEEAWPRVRPWVGRIITSYSPTISPGAILADLLDVERTGGFLARVVTRSLVFDLFSRFAWGQVRLTPTSRPLVEVFVLLTLASCIVWFVGSWRRMSQSFRLAVIFLALAGAVVWTTSIMRVLPLVASRVWLPSARYTFPAIIPTALVLVGGWYGLWPRRYRVQAAVVLVVGMVILNLVAITTIRAFYQTPGG